MAHCLKGFLQRLFQFSDPENTVSFEESISLQENNPSEIDDARCDWTTTDEESGEGSDEESDEESSYDDEHFKYKWSYQVQKQLNALGWPKNARIDPWMAAVWQNAVRSPLCGLPDPILLNIMQRLDLTAICQLRRASRDFLRLFSYHEFKKWRYKGSDYKFLWASPVQAPDWQKTKRATHGCGIPRKGHGAWTPWVASTLIFVSAYITKAEAYSNLFFTPKHQKRRTGWETALVALSEFRRCGKHKKCLILELTRSFSTTDDRGRPLTPSSPGWYLALDPASHNLTEDDEFKEVTWCEDQACRNYYKLRENANLGTA
ncbi:unnamed protein product [Colletotrichum noveboracense]|uniref:F-box domain-containing protein n=1 Tax=Colletotrichum noveboracense TaxID=2664923 RepID=A0A9W4S101_9PEZI|nr:unnamed protein product [Colletotrichum noveboracense]